MRPEIGKKYLLTTREWFYGADGKSYRAVFGTARAILTDQETLGIATNRNSSNWYMQIGELIVAGCQIHYALRTDSCELGNVIDVSVNDGVAKSYTRPSYVFDADAETGYADEAGEG